MKTKLTFAIILFASFLYLGSSAQSYYYLSKTGTATTYDFTSSTTFIMKGITAGLPDTMSAAQTIPFKFNFFGTDYTSYKISDNGYITFDVTQTKSNPTNETLPSATAPMNSIFAFWDALNLSLPDATYRYAIQNFTYGTTPNRVHVIQWFQMHSSAASTTSLYTFAIRLYESGSVNFDVVYNLYYKGTGTEATTSGTVGCQNVDATLATVVSGSPAFEFPKTVVSTTQVDDIVYEFYYGTQKNYDLAVTKLSLSDIAKLNTANAVIGEIRNLGKTNITSFTVKYSIDGNTVSTPLTAPIPSNGTYVFNATAFTPTTGGGKYHPLKVWVDGINGTNADENVLNDTAYKSIFYSQGVSASKRTLIEEFSTVPCGYCPEGHIYLNQIMNAYPKIIGVIHHAGYGTDAMTITEHNTYATDFADGAPTAAIDRAKFVDDAANIAISRNLWETKAVERLNIPAPCSVQIYGTYDAGTKSVSATVEAKFVDYVLPGDLRITLFVVEDHVTGSGTGYDQTNYFYGTAGHPMYHIGTPSSASTSHVVGYDHRHVVRDVISPVWGTTLIIPSSPVLDQAYTKTYTKTLDPTWNADSVFLVGFVSYYDLNKEKRTILNSFQVYVKEMKATPQAINDKAEYNTVSVYPNPVNDFAQIDFTLDKTSNVSFQVFNTLGQKVQSTEASKYTAGNQTIYFNTSSLEQGAYIGILNVDGKNFTTKFIK